MSRLPTLRLLTLAGLGPLAALPTLAQDDSYFYGGLGAGRAGVMVEELAMTRSILPTGVDSTRIQRDDRDTTYKVFAGYQFNRYLALETGFFNLGRYTWRSPTAPAGVLNGQIRFQGMNLDLVGSVPMGERVTLLGRVGAHYTKTRDEFSGNGAALVSNPNPSDRETNLKVGAGLQYAFGPSFFVRGEVEHYRVSDALGGDGAVNALTLSLVFPFGRSPQKVAMAAPAPAYVAPPPPSPPVARPVEAPMPVPVPVVVAPPVPRRVSFSAESLFGFDQSQLQSAGRTALDGFARELDGTRFDRITVEGHTDRLGAAAYNQTLSQQRAEVVKTYLVTEGRIDPARIDASGRGETQPVTLPDACKGSSQSAALILCLQADRRVEIEVTGTR
jgi:OmpA-OmpF porin, OOP family